MGQGQGIGRGRPQDLQAESSGRVGQVCVIIASSLCTGGEIVLGGRDLKVQRPSVQINRMNRVHFYSCICRLE